MDAESTAQQWSAILDSMHALAATGPLPVSATAIALRAGMGKWTVERQLRLMRRVGLVRHARRGWRRGWLLENGG